MSKIYLSSTYNDLNVYREAVYHVLRQMRCDVIAMEDYVATDQRPSEKCLADVADSDLYIGIFAWRYGYIPSEMNPEHKSITELEYRKATQEGKTCLIFILARDAPWPPTAIDAVTGEGNRGEFIALLLDELIREKTVKFFKAPEELASSVSMSVNNWEMNRRLDHDLIRENNQEDKGYDVFLAHVKQTLSRNYPGRGAFIVRGIHDKSRQMLYIRTLDSYIDGERKHGAEEALVQRRTGELEGTGIRYSVIAAVSYGYAPGTYIIFKDDGTIVNKGTLREDIILNKGTVRGEEVIEFEI